MGIQQTWPSESRPFMPQKAVEITPDDDVTFANETMIYVGWAGLVKVDTWGGDVGVSFVVGNMGAVLPVTVSKVYATDTTASHMVGVF